MVGKLDVGEVITEIFRIYRDDFLRITAMVLVALSPSLLMQVISLFLEPFAKMVLSLSATLPGLICQQIAAAALVHLTFCRLRGTPTTAGASFRTAWRRLWPLVLLAVLLGMILFAGALLLLIPGLIAMVWLYVAIPVVVIEETGPIEAMRRSIDLTEGRRWPLFFIVCVLLGLGLILGLLGMALIMGVGERIGGFAQLAMGVISTGIGGVAQSVVYYRLRWIDGDVEELAAVFA